MPNVYVSILSLLETGAVSAPPPSATSPTSKGLSPSLGVGAHAYALTLSQGWLQLKYPPAEEAWLGRWYSPPKESEKAIE